MYVPTGLGIVLSTTSVIPRCCRSSYLFCKSHLRRGNSNGCRWKKGVASKAREGGKAECQKGSTPVIIAACSAPRHLSSTHRHPGVLSRVYPHRPRPRVVDNARDQEMSSLSRRCFPIIIHATSRRLLLRTRLSAALSQSMSTSVAAIVLHTTSRWLLSFTWRLLPLRRLSSCRLSGIPTALVVRPASHGLSPSSTTLSRTRHPESHQSRRTLASDITCR